MPNLYARRSPTFTKATAWLATQLDSELPPAEFNTFPWSLATFETSPTLVLGKLHINDTFCAERRMSYRGAYVVNYYTCWERFDCQFREVVD